MSTLDHPAPSFEAGGLFDRLGFLAAAANVCGEEKFPGELPHLAIVVALVQTEALRRAARWGGTLNRNVLEGLPRHLEVDAVDTVDGEAEWDSASVRQHAPLRSP